MGLLSGSAAITRFRVASKPPEPDFDRLAFAPILPQSERRESIGFVPFTPEAAFRVGHDRFAFRVRIDRRRPEAAAVRERLAQLVASELEATGRDFVGSKRRRELKALAEDELLAGTAPRTRVIECCLDGDVLLVASTAKAYLGVVQQLVRQVGIVTELLTPWGLDDGHDDPALSAVVEVREPGQSVLGSRALKRMLEDPEVLLEPEAGTALLRTRQARISLAGEVMADVFAYLEAGAEILAAKLVIGDFRFRFDGLAWRVSGLRFERTRYEHWTEGLDARLERIHALFERLDGLYRANQGRLRTAGFGSTAGDTGGAGEVVERELAPVGVGDGDVPF